MEHSLAAYWDALEKEVSIVARAAKRRLSVHTLFFGGGTPSLVPARYYKRLFSQITAQFDLSEQAEISLEANPGTVNQSYLDELREVGFNRISFGMQSAHPQELAVLERTHRFQQVVDAVRMSRRAGFDNLSLDLIYGLPDQTLDRWNFSLDCAMALQPEHLSLYSLTIEEGTRLQKMAMRGIINVPEDDLAAEMYEISSGKLLQAGYQQYEISNWWRNRKDGRDFACRHNLQYWIYAPYLGFGAGAHGFVENTRTANQPDIPGYIRKVQNHQQELLFPHSPAAEDIQILNEQTRMGEYMMVGLRLTETGVSKKAFFEMFKQNMDNIFSKQLVFLHKKGLLETIPSMDGDHVRLTEKGRLLGNQVFMQFVGED